MIFSPNQVVEILKILEKYTNTFLAFNVGSDILSKDDIKILRSAGINISKINNNRSNLTQAFKFGLLSDAIGNKNTRAMDYKGFLKFIESGKFIELSELENNSLQSLKHQTYADVKNLESKMKYDFRQELVKADKKSNTVTYAKSVTESAKRTIERRKGTSHIVSELGHMTDKWNKDLGRISDYVLHTAFDEGRSASFEKREGKGALVFKDVYPGACKHCTKAFLTGGVGSEPKVFKLSELKDNGTNIGKSTNDWLPVIGPIHPWCRCTLERVPYGFTTKGYSDGEWVWSGSNFTRVRKANPKVKRERVRVVINGEVKHV